MFRYLFIFLRTFIFILFFSSCAFAQEVHFQSVDTKTNASFRGLCVINDSVAWVSGSNGWVGITVDSGRNWTFSQVKGFEKCDFRSIYAFNAKSAVIANAGSPAYVLRTADGGITWQAVYENKDTAAFIDGMDFRDPKNGVVYGDPINGRMLMLGTHNGGKTWAEYSEARRPVMSHGEASFAASGTGIKCLLRRKIIVATGGKVSRLLVSKNRGRSWRAITTPILQGESSTGIFSFVSLSKRRMVIAGGDYKQDTLRTANLFYTYNGGKTWYAPATTTRGYRECLAVIGHSEVVAKRSMGPDMFLEPMSENTLLAVGPGGIDISYDNGERWKGLSNEKQFHVVKKSRRGNLVIMAGGGGKLCVLRFDKH